MDSNVVVSTDLTTEGILPGQQFIPPSIRIGCIDYPSTMGLGVIIKDDGWFGWHVMRGRRKPVTCVALGEE
jgi:hypothetical protein